MSFPVFSISESIPGHKTQFLANAFMWTHPRCAKGNVANITNNHPLKLQQNISIKRKATSLWKSERMGFAWPLPVASTLMDQKLSLKMTAFHRKDNKYVLVLKRTKDFLWFLRKPSPVLSGVSSIRSEGSKDVIFEGPNPHLFPWKNQTLK